MGDVSIKVMRLEKELGFWTKMYKEEILEIKGTAVEQTNQIKSNLEKYRGLYIEEMQTALGKDFLIGRISGIHELNPLRNHFFPMEYHEKFAGIILPFRKEKKVISNPRINDNKHALEVFSNLSYKIEKIVCGYDFCDAILLAVCDEENMSLVLSCKDLI
jgi:hypothetical protein